MSPKPIIDRTKSAAIARACGWKPHDEKQGLLEVGDWYRLNSDWASGRERRMLKDLPDYLNNRDAIHEAIDTLTPKQFEDFRWILWSKVKRPQVTEWYRAYLCAPASVLADAFLDTLKLNT